MLIGTLGQLPFICAFGRMLTFSDLSRKTGARWAQHDVIGQKPLVEYVGPDLNEVSLKMRFDTSLGIPPLLGLDRLQRMMENKEYKTLIIGGEYLGRYVIESVSEDRRFHTGSGICIVAEASVELKEYAYGPRNYFN